MQRSKSLDVFKIASGLIMVVAILTSMFAVGSLGKLGLEKLMGVDNCFYTRPMVEPKDDDVDYVQSTEDSVQAKQCKEESNNNTRRQIADSLAILLVSIPLSVLFYKQTKK